MRLSDSQQWLVLAGFLALGAVFYLLSPILTPFLVAALLAYMGDPLTDRFEAIGLSRTWSVVIVFLLIFIVLTLVAVVLVPLIQEQIEALNRAIPKYIMWINMTAVPWLQQTLGVSLTTIDIDSLKEVLQSHLSTAGGVAATVASYVSKSGLAVLGWTVNLMLIPIVTFYLLRDWDVMVEHIRTTLPRSVEPTVSQLADESDDVLGAFIRGQFTVMLALGTIYSIGLWLVGLELSLLIGMIAGLVSFVPYLGVIIGLLMAGLAVLFQSQDLTQLLLVVGVFGLGQFLEGSVLTPLLVGDRIGLHPVAVIFAVLAGGQLFGFVGVLIALPVAAVLAVLVRYANDRYKHSDLYKASEEEV